MISSISGSISSNYRDLQAYLTKTAGMRYFQPMRILSSHEQVQILTIRYGSRRAVIEEIDRRKRLTLLSPQVREDSKAETGVSKPNPKIKNEPNPFWREIDTPSLLIAPSTNDGTRSAPVSVNPVMDSNENVQIGNNRTCSRCGCPNDDYTVGCSTCKIRHSARRRKQQLSKELGK